MAQSVDDRPSRMRQISFENTLFDRLRAIPGVEQVGGVSSVPLAEGLPNGIFAELNPSEVPKKMEDFEKIFQIRREPAKPIIARPAPAISSALGIPLIRGRIFDDRDTENAPHVALISQSLAKQKWPGQDPIGHTVEFGNMDGDVRLLTIVGIVGDTHEDSLERPANPTIYVDIRQRPKGYFTVVMRADADPSSGIFGSSRHRATNWLRMCRQGFAHCRRFIRLRWVRDDLI